jgi:hypothetical protein
MVFSPIALEIFSRAATKSSTWGGVAVPLHYGPGFVPSQGLDFKVGYAGLPPQGDEAVAARME